MSRIFFDTGSDMNLKKNQQNSSKPALKLEIPFFPIFIRNPLRKFEYCSTKDKSTLKKVVHAKEQSSSFFCCWLVSFPSWHLLSSTVKTYQDGTRLTKKYKHTKKNWNRIDYSAPCSFFFFFWRAFSLLESGPKKVDRYYGSVALLWHNAKC